MPKEKAINSPRPMNIVIREILTVISVERYMILILILAIFILQILSFLFSHYNPFLDYIANFLANIATGLVGGIVIFIILDRSIKHLSPIGEHNTLPIFSFIESISTVSKKEIRILDTWSYLFNQVDYRAKFNPAVREALNRRVKIYILLIDPNSAGAKQRAEELGNTTSIDVIHEIMLCIGYVQQLINIVDSEIEDVSSFLEVKIYDANPSITFHSYDNMSYISFFPVTQRADKSPHLEVPLTTSLGKLALSRFNEILESAIPLNEYLSNPENSNVTDFVNKFLRGHKISRNRDQ